MKTVILLIQVQASNWACLSLHVNCTSIYWVVTECQVQLSWSTLDSSLAVKSTASISTIHITISNYMRRVKSQFKQKHNSFPQWHQPHLQSSRVTCHQYKLDSAATEHLSVSDTKTSKKQHCSNSVVWQRIQGLRLVKRRHQWQSAQDLSGFEPWKRKVGHLRLRTEHSSNWGTLDAQLASTAPWSVGCCLHEEGNMDILGNYAKWWGSLTQIKLNESQY